MPTSVRAAAAVGQDTEPRLSAGLSGIFGILRGDTGGRRPLEFRNARKEPFSPSLTQQNGYMHAGAITAVLDSACGYAALTVAADDKDVLTAEFKVNLLAPASGQVFAARAQVKKAGRTLTVCTADAFAISDDGEKLVATMLATIMAVPIRAAK